MEVKRWHELCCELDIIIQWVTTCIKGGWERKRSYNLCVEEINCGVSSMSCEIIIIILI
jgi:hypothetical protein